MFFRRFHVVTIILLIFSILISGCVSTFHSDGIVVSSKKINYKNLSHHLKKGAAIGGITSAAIGASIGGFFGVVLANLGPAYLGGSASSSALLGYGLSGAAIGGVTFGIVGVIIGGGIGLAQYRFMPDHSMYQYEVKSLADNRLIIIRQDAPEIPVNSRVRIFKKKDSAFIRRN